MERLKTPLVDIDGVLLGGKSPVVIQSMTNTDTSDVNSTVKQIIQLAEAGASLVRMTVNDHLAAQAVPNIRKLLDRSGYQHLPLVGDFHYNGHTLLSDHPEMAQALAKYRINPGNVGFGDKHDYNFQQIIETAIKYKKVVRIGVNGGSLDQDLLTDLMSKNAEKKSPKSDREVFINAMVESAMRSAQLAEQIGLMNNKIVLSVKMSDVQEMVSAYKQLVLKMHELKKFYAIHLGLTEAGSGLQGIVSSTAALSILLQEGIGDTRVSITPGETESRTKEIEVAKDILQSLNLSSYKPKVTSCPGCGRAKNTFFQKLNSVVNKKIEQKLPGWLEKYPHAKNLKIAIMGCIVNGPGEAKDADIAISLPGKMEKEVAPIYIQGKYHCSISGQNVPDQFVQMIEDYLHEHTKSAKK